MVSQHQHMKYFRFMWVSITTVQVHNISKLTTKVSGIRITWNDSTRFMMQTVVCTCYTYTGPCRPSCNPPLPAGLWFGFCLRGIHQSASRLTVLDYSPTDPAFRANLFLKVMALFCWLPLSTLRHWIEAVHLGDLLRLWVQPDTIIIWFIRFLRAVESAPGGVAFY